MPGERGRLIVTEAETGTERDGIVRSSHRRRDLAPPNPGARRLLWQGCRHPAARHLRALFFFRIARHWPWWKPLSCCHRFVGAFSRNFLPQVGVELQMVGWVLLCVIIDRTE